MIRTFFGAAVLFLCVAAEASRAASLPRPSDQATLSIEVVDFASFARQSENLLPIRWHAGPGYDRTELIIENLNEFPGATFDKLNGEFRWELQNGPVEPGPYPLRLKLYAFSDDSTKPVIGMTKTVLVFVSPEQ